MVIEDVKNSHLLAFCKQYYFTVLADFYPDTYIVNRGRILSLDIPPLKRYGDYLN